MQIGNVVTRLKATLLRWMGRDPRAEYRELFEQKHGSIQSTEADGIRLAKIDRSSPDAYRTYREIQQAANKLKLRAVFVVRENVAHLARIAEQRLGTVGFVLCHGTRNGAEQRWFKEALSGTPKVLGTEISDTATAFPDTVQWDFHDRNPEWVGRVDVIYSNSWDHSIDPEAMFRNWMECLTPRGIMFIEHTNHHRDQRVDALDPFGATREGLIELLNRIGGQDYKVTGVVTDLPNSTEGRCAIVVERAGAAH